MKQKQTFTLVELLVVIGIIAILAGLVIPAVIKAQMQGRITQAKSDMATILLALKGVESTYNKMVNGDSSFDGKTAKTDSAFPNCIILGGGNDTSPMIVLSRNCLSQTKSARPISISGK